MLDTTLVTMMIRPEDYVPGTTVNDRYEVLRRLGGTGFVYAAWDRVLKIEVAIKLLHPAEGAAQSWDEAQRLEQLRSQFIVNVVNADVILGSDIRYIATELQVGGDLERAGGDGLSTAEAVRYSQQIASGVDRIHAAGMLHRDIKPANVLLSGDTIVVADLEYCEITDPLGRANATGSFCTVAPETAADGGYCSIRSDVYSLGATAFYLLSGEYPADHRLDRAKQKELIVAGAIREIRDVAPHVSQAIGTVIRRSLSFDPSARYESAEAFGNALAYAARDTRSWRRLDHDGHIWCFEGDTYRGKSAVAVCSRLQNAQVVIEARYANGRRVAGAADVRTSRADLVRGLRNMIRSQH